MNTDSESNMNNVNGRGTSIKKQLFGIMNKHNKYNSHKKQKDTTRAATNTPQRRRIHTWTANKSTPKLCAFQPGPLALWSCAQIDGPPRIPFLSKRPHAICAPRHVFLTEASYANLRRLFAANASLMRSMHRIAFSFEKLRATNAGHAPSTSDTFAHLNGMRVSSTMLDLWKQ